MTPPITVFVALAANAWFGDPFTLHHLLLLTPSVFIVDVTVVILAWLVRRAYRKPQPRPVSAHVPPPAIRDRLPPRLARAELHAVQAEDHYLRIHTSAGNDLILMKLADALEALTATDGMQVHRSWWVARHAVEHARWRRGRGELELKGGLKVPVSTRHAAAVKQTDWA
jgi:DNA-binding LytR/AlgR family response regulator